MSRVFGQKKSAGDGICYKNSMTISEFAAHYPELCPLIVAKLEGAARDGLYSITKLPTSLFPVLTILSHLAPETTYSSLPPSVKHIVCEVAYSPVYSLRVLASRAYPALLRPSQLQSAATELVKSLAQPDTSPRVHSANYIHGVLLQLEQLLETEDKRKKLMAEDVLNGLLNAQWIMFGPRQTCDLVKGKYLEVVGKCCERLDDTHFDKTKLCSIVDRCVALAAESHTPATQEVDVHVGAWLYREQLLQLFLTTREWTSTDLQEKITTFILDCPVMRPACLRVLKHCLQSHQHTCRRKDIWHKIKGCLFKYVCRATKDDRSDLSDCLDLIVNIHEQYGLTADDCNSVDLASVAWRDEVDLSSTMSAKVLEVSAIAILNGLRSERTNCAETFRFCQTLLACSKSCATEHHQRAAGRSLGITGRQLLVAAEANSDLEGLLPILIQTTLNLLHNLQPEIRAVVGKFICSLPWKPADVSKYYSLQTPMCLQIFCEVVSSKFSWSRKCVECLLSRLYQPGEATQLSKQSLFSTDSDLEGRELCIEARYLHKTLKVIFIKFQKSKLPEEYLAQAGESLSVDLRKCCQFTKNHEQSIFSSLTTPLGINCLIRLLLTSDLLTRAESPLGSSVQQIILEQALYLKQVASLTAFWGELNTEDIVSLTGK